MSPHWNSSAVPPRCEAHGISRRLSPMRRVCGSPVPQPVPAGADGSLSRCDERAVRGGTYAGSLACRAKFLINAEGDRATAKRFSAPSAYPWLTV